MTQKIKLVLLIQLSGISHFFASLSLRRVDWSSYIDNDSTC